MTQGNADIFSVSKTETVATPEGDNEFTPDQALVAPVVEGNVAGLQTPAGSGPAAYDSDGQTSESEEIGDEIGLAALDARQEGM